MDFQQQSVQNQAQQQNYGQMPTPQNQGNMNQFNQQLAFDQAQDPQMQQQYQQMNGQQQATPQQQFNNAPGGGDMKQMQAQQYGQQQMAQNYAAPLHNQYAQQNHNQGMGQMIQQHSGQPDQQHFQSNYQQQYQPQSNPSQQYVLNSKQAHGMQQPQQVIGAQFADIQPRTREERNHMGDREMVEQARLKDRIGQYHKYVDNALVNAPDPNSSHFLPENDRFNRDFATNDKLKREQDNKRKMALNDSRRIQKYERDLARWDYMEDEQTRQSRRIEKMTEKYQVGNHNKAGSAYNILNLNYENSKEGEFLQNQDYEKQVRGLLRSRHIDMLSNSGYNLTNGQTRQTIQVPDHQTYNKPPSSAHSALAKAGSQVFGDGFAGRPLRMEEKLFGKRVGNSAEEEPNRGGYTPQQLNMNQQASQPQLMQQNQQMLPINQAQTKLYNQNAAPNANGNYPNTFGNGQQNSVVLPNAGGGRPPISQQFSQGGAGSKYW